MGEQHLAAPRSECSLNVAWKTALCVEQQRNQSLLGGLDWIGLDCNVIDVCLGLLACMLQFSPLSRLLATASELRARGPPACRQDRSDSSSFIAHRSHQLHLSMATPGGPLLTVGDMLRDLSEDSSGEKLLNPPSFPASSPSGLDAAAQNPNSGLAEEVLPKSFQVTYKQLDAALKQSGHTWTGLTQELCATLTTADKLVATAHSNLGGLSQEVKRLEEVVERGQGAIVNLHFNLGMVTNVPEPGRQPGR